MDDCLFCKIARGEIPVQKLVETEEALAFPDIRPEAPTHVLVIPKVHIFSLADVMEEQWPLVGRLLAMAVQVARLKGLDGGFRTVLNTGPDGVQTVFHLHLHVLGGRRMRWPPG